MKSESQPKRGRLRRKLKRGKEQSGIAIVTVLSVLLLMSLLMLGFFSGASSELESSRHYASSLRTRQLADIVTNMVVAQIREATTLVNRGGQRTTWSSQPGLITTFGSAPSPQYASKVLQKYKLYSSHDMTATARDLLTDETELARDWQDQPHKWVNLNAPVWNDLDQELFFPIIDPRAFRGLGERSDSIEGFTYSSITSRGLEIEGVVGPREAGGDLDKQRLPMPVEWLYILDDGTIGHLNESDSFIPAQGGSRPSRNNPITARVAFWTDDESCKINVNTACEAVPWDTPRYSAPGERNLSKFQPAQREYNRYPGHPSTVCLSSVLFPHQDVSLNKAIIEEMTQLAPRIGYDGGTEAGTRKASADVKLDEHRLYATPDEMLYRQGDIRSITASGDSPRQLNRVFSRGSGPSSPRELFKYGRHFFTANSNAPEITLLGTPKMSMWPLPVSEPSPSVYDRLIGFCSTIGPRKYYWRRDNPNSRHWEVYGNLGGENLRLLYDYLSPITDERVPGYGLKLNEKYGGASVASDNFQILTQCWDTFRTTNLLDPLGVRYGNASGQTAPCCLCGGRPSGSNHATAQHRDRWDRAINPAKGYGRLYAPSEVTMVFRRVGSYDIPDLGPAPLLEIGVLVEAFCPGHGFTKILPESYIQINGPPRGGNRHDPSDPDAYIGERFVAQNDQNVRGNKIVLINPQAQRQNGSLTIGGTQGGNMTGRGRALEQRFGNNLRSWGGNGGPLLYSNTPIQFTRHRSEGSGQGVQVIAIPNDEGTITVSPGRWRVIMYDDNDTGNGNLIQMAEIDWPTFRIPIPQAPSARATWSSSVRGSRTSLIQPEDITRSMVVSHGDYRLVAANRLTRANNAFKPHPMFNEQEAGPQGARPVNHAHSLTDMDGFKFYGFSVERFMIPDAKYSDALPQWAPNQRNRPEYTPIPDFPFSPSNPLFAPSAKTPRGARPGQFKWDPAITGDFDNGLGFHIDGPYINRVDDGSAEGDDPYFNIQSISKANENIGAKQRFFSPNRMIAGPGQYGSMPTGIRSHIPWRTLLFRPDPQHFGAPNQPRVGSLPDHLYMDLFWMPVVEPYAISMPFATRGKINLNYQIIPFDNIKRATALHAMLKGERVVAIPTDAGDRYKKATGGGGEDKWRRRIDAYQTLKQAENRFVEGEVFRSPTEICELYLVPEDEELGEVTGRLREYTDMRKFWENHKLTGDNTKERPYANMQPRLTTKSNVFKVHMMVQTLKKVRGTPHDGWDVVKDTVTGQWRGSAVIERYIDPSDPRIPDYLNKVGIAPSLETFYSYRVLDVKQFSP